MYRLSEQLQLDTGINLKNLTGKYLGDFNNKKISSLFSLDSSMKPMDKYLCLSMLAAYESWNSLSSNNIYYYFSEVYEYEGMPEKFNLNEKNCLKI